MKITVSSCDNVAVPGREDWIYWLVTDKGDYIQVQIGFDASKEDADEIIRRLTEPSK